MTKKYLDKLTYEVVGAAIEVHKAVGPGLLESLSAPKGLLVNFNCVNIFKEGQKTFVNELFRALPAE